MSVFYGLRRGIRNLIRWLPTIWHDEDWDQSSFYKFLATKFKHMEHLFTYDSYLANAPKIAHKIMIAKNLAKRLSDDNYLDNATIDYDKIYGEKDLATLEDIPGGTGSRLVWTEDKHQIDMFHKASKHSDRMRQQDKIMLFELLSKNINKWVD